MKRLWKRRLQFMGKKAFVIGGSIFVILLVIWISNYRKADMDWQEVDFSTELEDVYVRNIDLNLYGNYCVYSEDDIPRKKYYYILTPDSKLMGISFKGEAMAKADLLMQKLMDFDNGIIDEKELETYFFEVEGRIEKMKLDGSIDYYKSGIGWEELSEESKEYVLFYYVEAQTKKQAEDEVISLCFIMLIICAWPVGLVGRALFFGNGNIKKYLKKNQNSESLKQQLKNFFECSEHVPGFWIDGKYIAGLDTGVVELIESSKVVWAYGEENIERYSGIKLIHKRMLNLKTIDGLVYRIDLKKMTLVDEALDQIKRRCPWIVTGYSDRLKQLYFRDRERFLELAYNENMCGYLENR